MIPSNSHVLDAAATGLTIIATGASTLIMSAHASAEQSAELQLFLLPLIGAMIMTTGAWLLNPQEEARRPTLGRCIVALFGGTLAPQLLAALRPSVAELALKPVFLLSIGALAAWLFYIFSKPLFSAVFGRADKIVSRELDRVETLLPGSSEDKSKGHE